MRKDIFSCKVSANFYSHSQEKIDNSDMTEMAKEFIDIMEHFVMII